MTRTIFKALGICSIVVILIIIAQIKDGITESQMAEMKNTTGQKLGEVSQTAKEVTTPIFKALMSNMPEYVQGAPKVALGAALLAVICQVLYFIGGFFPKRENGLFGFLSRLNLRLRDTGIIIFVILMAFAIYDKLS